MITDERCHGIESGEDTEGVWGRRGRNRHDVNIGLRRIILKKKVLNLKQPTSNVGWTKKSLNLKQPTSKVQMDKTNFKNLKSGRKP